MDPKFRDPVIGTILRQISDDTGRARQKGDSVSSQTVT